MLRTFRDRRGLSRAALAARAGVSHQYIAALEAGSRRQPGLRILNALSGALELTDGEQVALIWSFAQGMPPGPALVGDPAEPTTDSEHSFRCAGVAGEEAA